MKIKSLITSILVVFTINVHAVDTTGLDTEQVKQLDEQIKQMRESEGPVLDTATNWARCDLDITRGISTSAADMGMSVQEFTNSAIGKQIVDLLVWKAIRATFARTLIGLMVMLCGLSLAVWLLRTHRFMTNPVYEDRLVFFGMFTKRNLVSFRHDSDIGSRTFASIVSGALSVVIGAIIAISSR